LERTANILDLEEEEEEGGVGRNRIPRRKKQKED
jgi:hypothetical protein